MLTSIVKPHSSSFRSPSVPSSASLRALRLIYFRGACHFLILVLLFSWRGLYWDDTSLSTSTHSVPWEVESCVNLRGIPGPPELALPSSSQRLASYREQVVSDVPLSVGSFPLPRRSSLFCDCLCG